MKRDVGFELAFAGRGGRRAVVKRAAVIVLEGAKVSDLRSSLAWAARFPARPFVIAVDGGLSTCRARRTRPDLFVGDLDSVGAKPTGIASRIYPVDKDFSDFAGALSEAKIVRVDVVVIAGLLGGRLDHEWANVQEAGAAAPEFAGLIAPTSRGLIVVTAAGVRARNAVGCSVSVFALGAGTRVSLSGTRWTLSRRRLAPGSLGLSNIAGAEVALDVHSGVAALVFPERGTA